MKVVSNSSPLINLAGIGKLALLRDLYDQLIIPEAVWQEVVVNGSGQPGSEEVESAAWIQRQAVTNSELVLVLRQDLDAGEAEAIALSLEIKADLLLMDERIGRETANYLGLHYMGILGSLIEAQSKGLISTLKPYLDSLRDISGFHVKRALYERVLNDAGENGS